MRISCGDTRPHAPGRRVSGDGVYRGSASQLQTSGPLFGKKLLSNYADNRPSVDVRGAEPTWLQPHQWDRLLVFVHIPKAAGTTMNDVLWHVYGRTYVNFHPRLSGYAATSVDGPWAAQVLALGGHRPFGFHREFGSRTDRLASRDGLFAGRRIEYVTVVRDPVDRLLSYHRFVTTFPAHRLHAETRKMNCQAFFEHMIRIDNGECRDQQCRLITNDKDFTLEKAIDFVERKYLAVATIDNVAGLVSYLGRRLEWPKTPLVATKNQSPKSTHEPERDFMEDFVDRYCRADRALFEHVRDHVSPRIN